jgi:hypothetical protein
MSSNDQEARGGLSRMLLSASILGVVALVAASAFASAAFAGTPVYSKSAFGVTEPSAVATNSQGDVYVAGSGKAVRFSKEGVWKETYGPEAPGYGPGFVNHPRGVAVDTWGDVWAADYVNQKLVEWTTPSVYPKESAFREVKPSLSTSVASDKSGYTWAVGDGIGAKKYDHEAKYIGEMVPHDWYEAKAISIDKLGYIWVVARSTLTNGWTIYKNDSAGKTLLASFALSSTTPAGIAGDGAGNVWVAYPSLCKVQKFSPSGALLDQFGSCTGTNALNAMSKNAGLATGPEGAIWVVNGSSVQKWVPTP